jgi:hypothetical protein
MGQFRIELAECHCGISDVRVGAYREICEAANEALVIDEDLFIANVRD